MNPYKKWRTVLFGLMFLPLTAYAEELKWDENDCSYFYDRLTYGSSITWTGDCVLYDMKNNLRRRQGHGIQTWYEDGKVTAIYEGNMYDSRRHGQGTLTWKENHRYCGSGSNTQLCGKKYVGTWVKGRMDCGKLEYWNGDYYEGCFDQATGGLLGPINSQKAAYAKAEQGRTKCEHLYIGKAVRVSSTDKHVDFDGVVLGFSPRSRRATVKYTEGSSYLGTKEVDCGVIKD